MKKFMTLCLAALMMLASATAIVADDNIMLICAEEDAAVEAVAVEEVVAEEEKEIVDLLVIDGVNAPKTSPLFVTAFGRNGNGEFDFEVNPDWKMIGNDQFPAGKAVVPFAFPRQVTITVDAGENGTVSVPAKFFAACNSSRTFDITANEGYEIADILVNGVSYGPANSVKLKNIQTSMDIEVVFAPIVVEEEVVETVVETEVVEVEVVEAEVVETEAEVEATETEAAEVEVVETETEVAETEAAETEAADAE